MDVHGVEGRNRFDAVLEVDEVPNSERVRVERAGRIDRLTRARVQLRSLRLWQQRQEKGSTTGAVVRNRVRAVRVGLVLVRREGRHANTHPSVRVSLHFRIHFYLRTGK